MPACASCRNHVEGAVVGATHHDRLCTERGVHPDVLVFFAAGPHEDAHCPWWAARLSREQLVRQAREDAQRWADADARRRTGRADARGEPEAPGADRRGGSDRRQADRRGFDRRSSTA